MGKEARENMIRNMAPIIPDIFKLWEIVECNFTQKTLDANKRYGTSKYSRYFMGEIVGK